jgi:hypothetical protein
MKMEPFLPSSSGNLRDRGAKIQISAVNQSVPFFPAIITLKYQLTKFISPSTSTFSQSIQKSLLRLDSLLTSIASLLANQPSPLLGILLFEKWKVSSY